LIALFHVVRGFAIMADHVVEQLLLSHNRPFNVRVCCTRSAVRSNMVAQKVQHGLEISQVQLVADLLATKGVKKGQAQRSLDTLAAAGKIRVKVRPANVTQSTHGTNVLVLEDSPRDFVQEFGKAKIYYSNRDREVLPAEVLSSCLKDAALLQRRALPLFPDYLKMVYDM
jgi:hypothetical protein